MTEQFDVAVVVPHFNQPESLSRTVAALRAQITDLSVQVIVVDDGSRRRVGPLGGSVGTISVDVVHAAHRGPAAARNRGLAEVAAPIVAFTDADCVPRRDWVESMVRHFGAKPKTVAITGPVVDVTSPSRVNVLHGFFHRGSLLDHEPQRFTYSGIDMLGMIGANLASRTEFVRELGGFDIAYPYPGGEDYDLALRLQRSGATVDFVADAVVEHDYPTSIRRLLRRWYTYGYGKQVFREQHGLLASDLHLGKSAIESLVHLPSLTRSHFQMEGRLSVTPLLVEACFQIGAASARHKRRPAMFGSAVARRRRSRLPDS